MIVNQIGNRGLRFGLDQNKEIMLKEEHEIMLEVGLELKGLFQFVPGSPGELQRTGIVGLHQKL